MNELDVNYSGILFPLPYREKALQRSDSLSREYPELAELYRSVFDSRKLRFDPLPIDLPFGSTLSSQSTTALNQAIEDLPLSIVTVTRNDDHVERMHERTQAFIDSLYFLAEKYQRNVELIIVEWNPPADTPLLEQAFTYPRQHDYVSTVIVTVPESIHRTYDYSDALPLFQMIGKNVGIRRARGQFVLATNVDVLLSEELFDHISGPSMQKGNIYRSNRWDVDRSILDLSTPETMLQQARDLCFQINYPHCTMPVGEQPTPEVPVVDLQGYRAMPYLHTMACGDFQLLHREDWEKLRGYSEIEAYSFHIDSLFALTCHFAGIKEKNLGDDFPHYHIDHTLGIQVKKDTYEINEKKSIRHISLTGLINTSRLMEDQQDFLMFNQLNWGLADTELPIAQPTRAIWDTGFPMDNAGSTKVSKGALQGNTLPVINIDDDYVVKEKNLLVRILRTIADYIKQHHHNKVITIWGAGTKARVYTEFFEQQDISIHRFIHGDDNIPIAIDNGARRVDADVSGTDKDEFILVCSMYTEDIMQQLQSRNFKEGRDFLVTF